MQHAVNSFDTVYINMKLILRVRAAKRFMGQGIHQDGDKEANSTLTKCSGLMLVSTIDDLFV